MSQNRDVNGAALYRRTGAVIARRVAGELILLPKDQPSVDERHRTAELFVLNASAELLWEHLQEATSVSALARILTAEYDVQAETAQRDVEQFLDRMLAIGGVVCFQENHD